MAIRKRQRGSGSKRGLTRLTWSLLMFVVLAFGGLVFTIAAYLLPLREGGAH